MVIASKSTGTSGNNSTAATAKRKSKVPVSTSFSGLSKPRKPRGPRTPYNFFFADERAKMEETETHQDAAATMAVIKQGGPDTNGGIIPGVTDKPKPTFETTKARNKEIAKKWRHFAQMQKLLGDNELMKSYRAKAAEDEVRHKNEMTEYVEYVEAYNEAETEAEKEFLYMKTKVVAEARAKYGKKEKESNDDEARVQPSSSGSFASSSTTSAASKLQPSYEDEAATTMTSMASGLGLGRTPPQNRHRPGPPRHHQGAPADPSYMIHQPRKPPPQPYYHPHMPYYRPGGMYTMPPHMAHPSTLNAMMAKRAGEAAAAHMSPSMPVQAMNESVSASMAYLQGYAAACNAMLDRHTTPAQQQPPAPAPTPAPPRSDLETAVAAAGRILSRSRREEASSSSSSSSSLGEKDLLLEESPPAQKKADQDVFVAPRDQGQKTTEE